jgi:hypothetical protein
LLIKNSDGWLFCFYKKEPDSSIREGQKPEAYALLIAEQL